MNVLIADGYTDPSLKFHRLIGFRNGFPRLSLAALSRCGRHLLLKQVLCQTLIVRIVFD